MRPTLIFVYNADSGLFNTVTDIAHKLFSPATYNCQLCALTYGTFAIRAEWKSFLDALDADFEFLHRDELNERYGLSEVLLPAVFRKEGSELVPLLTAEQINACADLATLKEEITSSLGRAAGAPT